MKHSLFYKNLLETSDNLGWINDRETFLKFRTNPLLISTRIGYIPEFENLTIKEIDSLDVFLFEILSSDLIELTQIEEFVIKNNIKNVTVYTTEYGSSVLQSQFQHFKILCLDLFLRWVTYPDVISFDRKLTSIKKKFHCGNWKYSINRHLITSYMCEYDGYFSWYFSCPLELLKTTWVDFNLISDQTLTRLLNGSKKLETAKLSIDHNQITKVKIRQDTKKRLPVNFNQYINSYEKNFHEPHFCIFEQSVVNSFCVVVNETRYEEQFSNFSEKTIRALGLLTPFVLVAPPRTLEYLQKLGFKTFDKWWDESYDQETNHTLRILKIFKTIDYINSKSFEDLIEIYKDMHEVLTHNQTHLHNFRYNQIILQ